MSDVMLGNSRTLKINVITTSFDKYEEQLHNFLQNNNFEIVDIKICSVGLDVSVLIIYRDIPRVGVHPLVGVPPAKRNKPPVSKFRNKNR